MNIKYVAAFIYLFDQKSTLSQNLKFSCGIQSAFNISQAVSNFWHPEFKPTKISSADALTFDIEEYVLCADYGNCSGQVDLQVNFKFVVISKSNQQSCHLYLTHKM